jgi:hypothetical protein
MTVLQLAVESGASVLGEISGGLRVCCISFSRLQSSLPVFALCR